MKSCYSSSRYPAPSTFFYDIQAVTSPYSRCLPFNEARVSLHLHISFYSRLLATYSKPTLSHLVKNQVQLIPSISAAYLSKRFKSPNGFQEPTAYHMTSHLLLYPPCYKALRLSREIPEYSLLLSLPTYGWSSHRNELYNELVSQFRYPQFHAITEIYKIVELM